MDENLTTWYRRLRKYHSPRDAHNIARRLAWSFTLKLTREILRLPDVEHILLTAQVDYTWNRGA